MMNFFKAHNERVADKVSEAGVKVLAVKPAKTSIGFMMNFFSVEVLDLDPVSEKEVRGILKKLSGSVAHYELSKVWESKGISLSQD